MPQAPDELREKFPDGDGEAWEVLEANFVDNRGLISPKQKGYTPTDRENEAIDYLWLEWDYAYTPDPQVSS